MIAVRESSQIADSPLFSGVALDALCQLYADTYSVPEKSLAAEWIPENIVIPDQTESPGPFDLSLVPYVRGVLELLDDPEVEEIYLRWATRLGKTFTVLSIIAYWGVTQVKPIGFASSDGGNLEDNINDSLYPLLDQSPGTSDLMRPEHLRSANEVFIGRSKVTLANARSKASQANFRAQLMVCNEVGLWPLNAVQRLRHRVKNFRVSGKLLFEGKPESISDCTITRLIHGDPETKSKIKNVRVYHCHVPCPHCGKYQQLQWGFGEKGAGVKWDKVKGGTTEAKAIESAHYECVNGCRIESDDRPEMIRAGVWVAVGQQVDKRGRVSGKPEVQSKARIAFDELSSLYSLSIAGWGQLAQEWFECRGNKELLREFITGTLAIAYDPRPKSKAAEDVAKRLADLTLSRNELPEWARFMVLPIDCGFDEKNEEFIFFWQAQAWGFPGNVRRGHLVDWGECSGIDSLVELIQSMRYDHPDGFSITPSRIGIDSGDGKVATKVYAIARLLRESGFRFARPLKGDSRRPNEKESIRGWYTLGYFDERTTDQAAAMKLRNDGDLLIVRTHASQSWREGIVSGQYKPSDNDFFSLPKELAELPELFEDLLLELVADEKDINGRWVRSGPNEAGDLMRYGRALASWRTNHDKYWKRACVAVSQSDKREPVGRSSPNSLADSIVGSGELRSLIDKLKTGA